MINTDEFGLVTVGGMIDNLFSSMQKLEWQLLEVQFQKYTTKEY